MSLTNAKVIVINGAAGSGKDAFVAACGHFRGVDYVKNISTIDFIKYIATICGWDGTKTPRNRKFLSDLKDLLTQWNNVPNDRVIKEIQAVDGDWSYYGVDTSQCLIFIHCREPEDIDWYVTNLNAIPICIRRASAEEKETSNHADADVLNYQYQFYIDNNGTLEDLKDAAYHFLKEIGIEKFARN